ncbi:hypothetical protein O5167_15320 [Escherichia coli]|nr:hypothetical protein [Escherichia coli]
MPAPALYDINIRYRGYEWNDEYARKGITTFLIMVKSFAIGYTVRDVAKGSWIDESTVTLPKAPPLNTLPRATKVPEPQPPQEDYTFEGYRNADGSVGTKTCWVLPPACTAWQTLRTTWLKLSNATCCRNT